MNWNIVYRFYSSLHDRRCHRGINSVDTGANWCGSAVRSNNLQKKNRGKSVYQNALGAGLSTESLKVVLDSKWLCGGVSPWTCVLLLFFVGMNICSSLTSVNFLQVTEAYLGDLRIKMGDDRTLCPAWRANAIVEKPPVRWRWKKSTRWQDGPTREVSMLRKMGGRIFFLKQGNDIVRKKLRALQNSSTLITSRYFW